MKRYDLEHILRASKGVTGEMEDPTFREKIGEALQLARIANMMDEYDPQAEMEASHKQVGGWFDAFVGGPQYQPLTEIQRAKAPGIVRFFTECSFRHIGAAPEKWNQSVLKKRRELEQARMAGAGDYQPVQQVVRNSAKVGRNDPCPCDSGKKFKKCCGA